MNPETEFQLVALLNQIPPDVTWAFYADGNRLSIQGHLSVFNLEPIDNGHRARSRPGLKPGRNPNEAFPTPSLRPRYRLYLNGLPVRVRERATVEKLNELGDAARSSVIKTALHRLRALVAPDKTKTKGA